MPERLKPLPACLLCASSSDWLATGQAARAADWLRTVYSKSSVVDTADATLSMAYACMPHVSWPDWRTRDRTH